MNDAPPTTAPRILHVITRLDRGGSTTNTLTSVRLQRNRQFETALAYGVTRPPPDSLVQTLRAEGIACHFLPSLVRDPAPWRDAAAFLALLRLLRRERYDLVHTHTSKAGVLGRLAAARVGLPAVHTAHGHVFYGYFGPILTRAFVLVERAMARRSARLVSLTDAETRESLERRIGRPEQYVTIPSGVPLARFRNLDPALGASFRARWAIPPDAVLIVSVGRLTAVKGFDLLLPAFAQTRFPESPGFLALVGDGEERSALERLAGALGVRSRVIFTGDLDDVRSALAAADFFVLASRNEGMGRAIVEAMAAGLPAVAPAVGGVPEVIRHGENGLVVPTGDPAALAAALGTLASDPARRRAMGRRAAEWVYPRFDEATMVDALAALYREVLAEHAKVGRGEA
jgi:glycosyltransferase involved in cell wall biosynthesis